jgi:hypothetical protein
MIKGLAMSARKNVSDATRFLGTILMCGGGASLFVMAAVGTVSVDIVLLAFASKQRNGFLTGYILGSMWYRNDISPISLMIVSPLMTAIAIVLSVALGVAGVGFVLAAGWALSAALFLTGYGLTKLADTIAPAASNPTAIGAKSTTTESTVQTKQKFGLFKTPDSNNSPVDADKAPAVSRALAA